MHRPCFLSPVVTRNTPPTWPDNCSFSRLERRLQLSGPDHHWEFHIGSIGLKTSLTSFEYCNPILLLVQGYMTNYQVHLNRRVVFEKDVPSFYPCLTSSWTKYVSVEVANGDNLCDLNCTRTNDRLDFSASVHQKELSIFRGSIHVMLDPFNAVWLLFLFWLYNSPLVFSTFCFYVNVILLIDFPYTTNMFINALRLLHKQKSSQIWFSPTCTTTNHASTGF